MAWQLFKQPMVAAAYAVNLAVQARRVLMGRNRHTGSAAAIIRECIDDCWDCTHIGQAVAEWCAGGSDGRWEASAWRFVVREAYRPISGR